VKRILAALALLAAAACDTDPYGAQGPYGTPEPYPYPAPYPYPPGGPDDPVSYPPVPGEPFGQPQPPECPISASRGWAAWINAMPGPESRPRLVVTGKVVTPTGGHSVAFDRYLQIREIHPAQAFVTLHVSEPEGPATQAAVTHEVRWEWPLPQPVGSVVIRCGDKTLAEITNIQTAY